MNTCHVFFWHSNLFLTICSSIDSCSTANCSSLRYTFVSARGVKRYDNRLAKIKHVPFNSLFNHNISSYPLFCATVQNQLRFSLVALWSLYYCLEERSSYVSLFFHPSSIPQIYLRILGLSSDFSPTTAASN